MIIKIAYGFDVAVSEDPYVAQIEKAMEVVDAFVPGRFLIDALPLLRYVPAWMPGAGFQKKFAAWRTALEEANEALCVRAKREMVSSRRRSSVVLHAHANYT